MTYQALYRQWRPDTFSKMVGQEAIVKTLRNQIASGRIAHAYLFCGSRGTGKTSTAKIMAKAVNCLSPRDGDPCGECEVCLRLAEETTLDVIEIDAASNNGVDEIRELREHVKYPPQYGKYKVYIIDEVHMLSPAAFNALLKTLEEPPAHALFILATTEPQRLPATILSRCQRFDFGRIPAAKIVGRLREAAEGAGVAAEEDALLMIARAAEGGMRDALSILDMCIGYGEDVTAALVHRVLGTSDKAFLFAFTDALGAMDGGKVMSLIDELMRGGREPQVFAKDVAQHIRALLLALLGGGELESVMEITPEDAAQYAKQAGSFTSERLLRILDLFMEVETRMRYASSPRTALELAALRASIATEEVSVEAMAERIGELEGQLSALREEIAAGAVVVKAAAKPEKTVKTEDARQTGETSAPESKKAETAPSAPKAQPTGGGTPEEIWAAAINLIKRTEAGLFGQLQNGRFLGLVDGQYQVRFEPQDKFTCEYLNKDSRREVVEKILSEAAGTKAAFRAVLAGEGNKEKAKMQEATILSLIDTFGRGTVQIEEE